MKGAKSRRQIKVAVLRTVMNSCHLREILPF